MNNKKVDLLIAEIDSSHTVPLNIDVELIKTSTIIYDGKTSTKKYFPSQIVCYQESGVDIEFLFLTEIEYSDYIVNPTEYEFFKVGNGTYFQNDALPRIKYCIMRAMAEGATKDIRIDFINYNQYSEVIS